MARIYSSGAAALACLALVAGIAIAMTLALRPTAVDDRAPRPSPIEIRIPSTWSQAPQPP